MTSRLTTEIRFSMAIWPPAIFCSPTMELQKWPTLAWLKKCITKTITKKKDK